MSTPITHLTYVTRRWGGNIMCARGCKYFAKPKQMCKDGADCTRCHLCPWSRYKELKHKPASVREVDLSSRPLPTWLHGSSMLPMSL